MGDVFFGKSGTTLVAESVVEGGCILGLLAASAAMVSRISANKGGVATWKSREGCRWISCRGVFICLGPNRSCQFAQTRTLGKTEICFGIEDKNSDKIRKPLEPKMGSAQRRIKKCLL